MRELNRSMCVMTRDGRMVMIDRCGLCGHNREPFFGGLCEVDGPSECAELCRQFKEIRPEEIADRVDKLVLSSIE